MCRRLLISCNLYQHVIDLPKLIWHQNIKNKKIYTTLIFFLCLPCIYSQEACTSACADATGIGGTVNFSVGQVGYTCEGTNISISQGVQQAKQIPFATIVGINLRISIYPNPTTGILYVEVKNNDYPGLQFQLYDLNGKLLESKNAAANQTGFVMKYLAAGTYILQITENNKQVRSFKVIKN